MTMRRYLTNDERDPKPLPFVVTNEAF